MKNITILIIIFLYSCKTSHFKIENNETVFIEFNTSEFENKYIYKNSNILISRYTFFNKHESIQLVSKKFKNFDEMEKNNPSLNFRVDDSFLIKNTDIIINHSIINKNGFNKTFDMLKSAKHIFLIDNEEISEGKITIKEVWLNFIAEE